MKPKHDGWHFAEDIFKHRKNCRKITVFWLEFHYFFPRALIDKSGLKNNGLTLNRWLAITWFNDDTVHWCFYASLEGAFINSDNYLNQCWNIVNWTLRNILQWNINWNSKEIYLKMSAKYWPFCLGLSVLTWINFISLSSCISNRMPSEMSDYIFIPKLQQFHHWSSGMDK